MRNTITLNTAVNTNPNWKIEIIRKIHAGAEIHILSKNSHIENPNFHKIHLSKISMFTKFTFQKSHFSQNSHLWNLNFLKIHIYEILKSREYPDKKWVFAPVCFYYLAQVIQDVVPAERQEKETLVQVMSFQRRGGV